MNPVFKMLLAFIGTLAVCILAMAGMTLAWPDVSLVRQLGCFDSYGPAETFLLLPIQSHPMTFFVGAVLTLCLAAGFSVWQPAAARMDAGERT